MILYKKLKKLRLFGQVTTESQNCVTGEVERSLSQSQIFRGIQGKNSVVLKDSFDDFQRWNYGL